MLENAVEHNIVINNTVFDCHGINRKGTILKLDIIVFLTKMFFYRNVLCDIELAAGSLLVNRNESQQIFIIIMMSFWLNILIVKFS